jgi:hypothetical protein
MTSALNGIPLRLAGKRQQPVVFKKPGKALGGKIKYVTLAGGPYGCAYRCYIMAGQGRGKSGLLQVLAKAYICQTVLCKPLPGCFVKPVYFKQQAPERGLKKVFLSA